MRKRIVKVTFKDGSIIYRCERTGFFRRNTWRVITIETAHGCAYDAIFSSFKEAKKFLHVDDSQVVQDTQTVWENK